MISFYFLYRHNHRTVRLAKAKKEEFVKMISRRRTFSMSVPEKKKKQETKTRLSSLTKKDFLELVLNFLRTTRRLPIDGRRVSREWTCFAFDWWLCLLFVRLMWLIDLIFINLKYPKMRWVRNIKCDWNKLRRYLFFSQQSLLDLWMKKERLRMMWWWRTYNIYLWNKLYSIRVNSCNSWTWDCDL